MSDTFRQAVEKIQSFESCTRDLCKRYIIPDTEYEITNCRQCRTDRILAAHNAELDRIAGGMGQLGSEVPDEYECKGGEIWAYLDGASTKKLQCQSYIQAQKGS